MIPDWTNRDPQWIHLVWAVLVAVAAWIVLELRGRDALGRFLSPTAVPSSRCSVTISTWRAAVARLAWSSVSGDSVSA